MAEEGGHKKGLDPIEEELTAQEGLEREFQEVRNGRDTERASISSVSRRRRADAQLQRSPRLGKMRACRGTENPTTGPVIDM